MTLKGKVAIVTGNSNDIGEAIAMALATAGAATTINYRSIHEDWPLPGNSPNCLSKGIMMQFSTGL